MQGCLCRGMNKARIHNLCVCVWRRQAGILNIYSPEGRVPLKLYWGNLDCLHVKKEKTVPNILLYNILFDVLVIKDNINLESVTKVVTYIHHMVIQGQTCTAAGVLR